MDPYQYQPLPIRPEPGSIDYNPQGPRWFRLLTLAPGTGDEDLELKIEIYNLTDAPPYEALSYCWGPEEGELYVILVGWAKPGLIKVRPNLRQTLLHLRLPTQHRRLWIDAICINQGNNPEKADQIMFMRDIYQNANRTIIWLGTGNASIEGAFKLSGQIRQQMQYLQGFPTSYEEYNTLCEIRNQDFLQRGEVAISEWAALRDIFFRDWFTRVWVIQEVIASSWCICRCGNAEASFLDLLSSIQLFLDYSESPNLLRAKIVDGTFTFWTGVYHRKRELLAAGDKKPYQTPLAKILINSGGNFSCTDPRDMIYGVLGITSDITGGVTAVMGDREAPAPKSLPRKLVQASLKKFVEGSINNLAAMNPSHDPWRHPFLRPDYNKSVQEVYRDATRYLLYRSPRVLDILAVVDHDGDPYAEGYPSWVPRFDKKKVAPMRLGSGMWLTTKRWSEIDDNKMTPSRPNVLTLKGVNLGQVEQISRVMDFSTGPLPTIADAWSDISS